MKAVEENPINTGSVVDAAPQIINELVDGVIGYDTNFKISVFNPAAEKIFDLPAAEIIGQTITPDSLKKNSWRALAQVIFPSLAPRLDQISEPNQWPQINDVELSDPPRYLRTILIRLSPAAGRQYNFLKIVRDRTREKEILKSKSEFISVAAHQLRTPITAINWAFESLVNLAKDKSDQKEIATIAQEGHDVAQRSLKIINDLLDVSKMEGGRFGFQFTEIDINDFLKNIVEGLKITADYYKIKLFFQPIAESCQVFIDPQKLGLAVSNLIDNAIRYNNKDGEVAVTAEKDSDKPFVTIKIKDTGVGIPAPEINKLFTKFYRGSNVVQLEPNGSGLGLYIAKNIVEQHGGQIEIESTVGRGTTFRLHLPLDKKMVPQKEMFIENY